MSKKFVLGKGLGALIPDELEPKEKKNNSEMFISINLIKSNENQPRKAFDDEKIAELAESIKHHGIVQPIILRKDKENYIIVAGERRWRAAKLLALKEVPAVVMDLTDKQVLEISLIENIQRENLNPIEEAIAYKRLLSEFSLTQEELSKRIGKSRVSITNTMRLMNLNESVQQYIIDSVISEGHGRVLLAISDNNLQYEIAQKVIDEKLSVRELETIVKYLNKEKVDIVQPRELNNPYYKDITNRLENYFGTKVNINSKNNKGKIQIEYYSEEDLQRILEIINL
ncbi:ParB/RepB/Spo0J family partition protein [Clostridium gasigenes]|uniref:Chromosome partitioning protein, ParB family n=1 Tax=Clostridium gasigenes TaxID=94869 RepID=A0A1H0V7D2_9CLOT|nr:ParB/RepB/Spo0J family partition protein [Clostridium gasigenes]MBB6625397.1 ParB/RepB/Spo0J family partition protein [Clostridium gasigenes]MBU3090087.1 ParB/RepB/Spo0J family partition protein [Clostridium gasigenes]MBU3134470.1 ParB/RepB/Spo0J family partition protein [Clostridium gasigenes]MBU3138111.1 ParB/RepB/Spo0J family partition protein [Clostridium gasigenes]NKF08225.1 ParB/RepB/Spo0J family partition protein [Clostridium gasigenes]